MKVFKDCLDCKGKGVLHGSACSVCGGCGLIKQYSAAWWQLRAGVPTASQFNRIFTAVTAKPSSQQDDYIAELIADKICQTPAFFSDRGTGRPTTPEMQYGIDTEAEARAFYEMEVGRNVEEVGFILTDDSRFGCSPDGLVDPDGGLELKCPLLKTQVAYLMKRELPPEYKAQVHGALIVTGRAWWDFCSYAIGASPLLIRVEPDEYTEKLREALDAFYKRYQAAIERVAEWQPAEVGV